jgi:hypothetical protein
MRPDKFAGLLQSEIAKWAQVAKSADPHATCAARELSFSARFT